MQPSYMDKTSIISCFELFFICYSDSIGQIHAHNMNYKVFRYVPDTGHVAMRVNLFIIFNISENNTINANIYWNINVILLCMHALLFYIRTCVKKTCANTSRIDIEQTEVIIKKVLLKSFRKQHMQLNNMYLIKYVFNYFFR